MPQQYEDIKTNTIDIKNLILFYGDKNIIELLKQINFPRVFNVL